MAKTNKLDEIDAKLAKLKAQKQVLLARHKKAEKAARTHRMILLGSLTDSWMQKDEGFKERVEAALEKFLVKDRDRAAFGLPPRPKEPDR